MTANYSERRHQEIRLREAKEREKKAKKKKSQSEIDANVSQLDVGQGFFKSLFGKKIKK